LSYLSELDQPTLFGNNGECIGPQLGYTIDPRFIAVVTSEPALADLILKALTILLVLHPIAAGLAFLTLIPVIASCCVFHKAPWIISLVLSVGTAIMSTIVFAADLALVLVAKHKLREQHTVNVTISFGNGVWIVLVSTFFTWVALILLAARVCYCCGFGRY
jgi:SUR7/PalI family protein